MHLKNCFFILLISIGISSCGAKKTALSTKDLALRKIISSHEKAAPNFNTLRGRIRAGYVTKDDSQSISISLRIEKDKAIWLSAKLAGIIPLAKVLITPKQVKYYEKINQTYFVGDFRLLSKWLGTALDFEKVQNLLTGQSIYDLTPSKYKLEESKKGYQLKSEGAKFLTKLFLLNPKTFKVEAQQISKTNKNQSLTITYPGYQQINEFYFPKKIIILENHAGESTEITIEYRSLDFDVPVSFPFTIPSGYKEISIK